MSPGAKRYGMAVDTRRCVGCNACVIACKTENALPPGGFRGWVVQEARGTFPDVSLRIRSERCNQCEFSPCVASCPTGASHRGEGGVVLVNRAKCTGCKACLASCPYGARYVHPEAGFVDKCTLARIVSVPGARATGDVLVSRNCERAAETYERRAVRFCQWRDFTGRQFVPISRA